SAFFVVRSLSRRGYCDLPLNRVSDFITWIALFGVLLGGRVGYVLLYRPEMLHNPLSIIKVWEGGMASHGGMVGILLVRFYYARRHKLSWTNLGDALVVAAPIGLFFGRCANFINGELYGRPTTVSWATQFPKELIEDSAKGDLGVALPQTFHSSLINPEQVIQTPRHSPQVTDALRGILTPRHPSQLYEAFFEGIVLFAILWFVRTRTRQPNGVLTGIFSIVYAVFRIICENFREPDAPLAGAFTR